MRALRSVVLLFVLSSCASALAAQPPSPLAGKWTGTVDTDQGTMNIDVTLKVDDGRASGTIMTNHGELVISNGAFVKDRWRLPFSGHGMKGEIVGTLKGDVFDGVWDNSPTATGSVKLRRVK